MRDRLLDCGCVKAQDLDAARVGTPCEDDRERVDRAPRQCRVGMRLDVDLHHERGRDEIEQLVEKQRSLNARPPLTVQQPSREHIGGRALMFHQGPLGDWVVYLNDEASKAWAGRSLLGVLSELFQLSRLHGEEEVWVHELVKTLAGRETGVGVRYACPCCDYLTLDRPPPGTYAICPVCWWEDDGIQFRDLDYRGGASDPRLLERVRAPLAEEQP